MAVLVRCCLMMAAALSGASLGSVRLDAQGTAAPELTAAFLFNFVKFTTWPTAVLQDGGPIIVCVSGDEWVANSLGNLIRNQSVDGHPLWVRPMNLSQPLDACHVVYAAALDANNAQRLIQSASGHPILTVSDVSDFAQRGGVANFFIDGGRMRFAVNPVAAERVGLRISSKLLTLAKLVR